MSLGPAVFQFVFKILAAAMTISSFLLEIGVQKNDKCREFRQPGWTKATRT